MPWYTITVTLEPMRVIIEAEDEESAWDFAHQIGTGCAVSVKETDWNEESNDEPAN